jgi:hypothetical protein
MAKLLQFSLFTGKIHGVSEIPKRITGNDTCQFASGKWCEGCCEVLRIKDNIFPNGEKPLNVPCIFLKKFSKEGGQGCGIRGNAPMACNEYDCTYADPAVQARMLARQYRNGKIAREEALELGSGYTGMEILLNLNKPLNE